MYFLIIFLCIFAKPLSIDSFIGIYESAGSWNKGSTIIVLSCWNEYFQA